MIISHWHIYRLHNKFDVKQIRPFELLLREEHCQRVQERMYTIISMSECVYLSCPIFKFNDYKKKQERNMLVTNFGVYNLKGSGKSAVYLRCQKEDRRLEN